MKVPEPRKLKSGSYFIQLRLNGVSVPVTASTARECKRQAQLIKAEHMAGRRLVERSEKTLGELIDEYINKYEKVLSPATIRGYVSSRNNRFKAYMDRPVSSIKNWQTMINEELDIVSEKTVKNAWGLVTASMTDKKMTIPDVTLAVVPENDLPFLQPEEIPLFLEAIRGDKAEVEMLLELHGLRESETMFVVRNNLIDIPGNTIHVVGAIVPDKNHKYVEKKTNKTPKSTRPVPIMIPRLAELVVEYQKKDEPIPTHSASALLAHVHKACKRAGVTDVPNHGLRRSFCSLGYSLGLSELWLQEMGGWSDYGTMHRIYLKLAERDKRRGENAMTDFYRPQTDETRLQDAIKMLNSIASKYSDLTKLEPVFDAIKSLEKTLAI